MLQRALSTSPTRHLLPLATFLLFKEAHCFPRHRPYSTFLAVSDEFCRRSATGRWNIDDDSTLRTALANEIQAPVGHRGSSALRCKRIAHRWQARSEWA